MPNIIDTVHYFVCKRTKKTQSIEKNMTLEQLQKHFAQCNHNSVNATAKITSKEEMSVTGSFNFTLTVKATDTIVY